MSPPPPPTISADDTPPAPPPPMVSSAAASAASSAEQSLSIAETNKLRAKLGLKPLAVGPAQPVAPANRKPASQLMSGTDMGEFVHRPADNIAAKLKAEKLKAKLTEKKERRAIENKLSKVKKLADDSDDDDTSAWILKSRKIEEERKKAEKKAKELDDMDAVFGIGELVEDEIRNEKKIAYTNKDLRGLKVEHDIERFTEGREVVLTLKDRGVLDEDGDTLVNVNMLDDEHYRKNIENRKKNPFDYNALDDAEEDMDVEGSRVLTKYDEEIDGAKKQSFTLGVDEVRRKKFIKQKLEMGKKLVSLDMPAPQLASEYYTDEELIKFKKPKKKVRKLREKKKILKADDLLPVEEEGRPPVKSDPDEWDVLPRSPIKVEPDDMDIDDPYPEEDLSSVKIEADDSELEIALRKARKLKQKEALDMKSSVEKIVERVKTESGDDSGIGGAIVLNSTAEFCRTLGDIPTYGLAGNRDEEAEEILDFDKELLDSKSKFDEQKNSDRGGWNDVEMDDGTPKTTPYEAPILDAEPDLGKGVAGALRLAVSKGYLEKETTNRPSASRFAHLQAQNYSIEDKTHVEDDKFGRRERYCGPTSDFKEKDNYKPNVKLDYIDDDGHLLCAKEAFRYLSHKFHGKGPGKNKVEKRMKKNEQEVLMKQMSSTDTPLGTLNMLQQKQKETQSAFVVLSGSKHNQTPATISKTKI
ncbi:U4/U6.U5 tri-snRNP-associated protein 1-like isoform X2 [Nilaparvata lugens]|nr:U4/U6.U5 tri-snRNP-associated protein 1-like isoform X2 [Nilaparvata lugens]